MIATYIRTIIAKTLLCLTLLVVLLSPIAAQERLSDEVSDTLRNGVVQVIATSNHIPRRSASGFRWARPDLVVTAYHVVAGADSISVQSTANGIETALAKPIAFDVDGDLALLQLQRPLPGAPLSHTSTIVAPGSNLWVVGYPLNVAGYRSRRLWLSDIAPETLGDALDATARADLNALQFPALNLAVIHVEGGLLPGDSGAPIIDKTGRVIGIGNGGLKQGRVALGWGIPASRLDLLAERGIAVTSPDSEILRRIQTVFFSQLSRAQVDKTLWATTEQLDTLEAYRDYLNRFPAGAFASTARARLNILEQRYAQAIDYFRRAKDYQRRIGVGGDVRIVKEMHDRTEYNLRRAIRVYPRFEAAHFELGHSKYLMAGLLDDEEERQNAYKAAIDDLNNATDLNPELAEVYLYRGFAYSNISDHRYACEDYIRFIRLKDTLPPDRYERSRQNYRFTRAFLEYHGCDTPSDLEFDDPRVTTAPGDPNSVQRDCQPRWWVGEAEYCAELGDPTAMARIADRISLHGGSVEHLTAELTEELENGVKYATILAKRGDPRGFYHLGYMYWNGTGKPYVPELAFTYMKRAVDGEYLDAFSSLGQMYMNGLVGAPDYEAARQTWARGAVLEDALSASRLDDFELSASLKKQRARMFEDFKALIQRNSCADYQFQERGEMATRYESVCRLRGSDTMMYYVIIGLAEVRDRHEEAAALLVNAYPRVSSSNRERIAFALRDLRKITPEAVNLLRDTALANRPDEDSARINLDDTARKRTSALQALAGAGTRAAPVVNDILPLLASEDRHTRLMALGVIGEIADPALLNHISPLLSDPSVMVRLEAERYVDKLTEIDQP